MAIKTHITSIVAVTSALLAFTPMAAFAVDRCRDGTAPAGWKRPGGYCEISANMRGAMPFGHSGGIGPVLVHSNNNGVADSSYYSDGSGIETYNGHTYYWQSSPDNPGVYHLTGVN